MVTVVVFGRVISHTLNGGEFSVSYLGALGIGSRPIATFSLVGTAGIQGSEFHTTGSLGIGSTVATGGNNVRALCTLMIDNGSLNLKGIQC